MCGMKHREFIGDRFDIARITFIISPSTNYQVQNKISTIFSSKSKPVFPAMLPSGTSMTETVCTANKIIQIK